MIENGMHLLSVDFQNDFVATGGVHHAGQPCVDFVLQTVVPFARRNGLVIAENISDYRTGDGSLEGPCVPGTWGYESALPPEMRSGACWVKASIAPTWVRDGGGDAAADPGPPRSDPLALTRWLEDAIGPPDPDERVVVLGLMLEVCVLAALMDLKLRGYPVAVLVEGVDTGDGDQQRKRQLLDTLAPFWGEPITWAELVNAHILEVD